MKKGKSIALFDHHGCRTKFFMRLDNAFQSAVFKGKCPNPSCNRNVSLFPEVTFSSTDKARREYIKLITYNNNRIFWHI